MVPYGGGRAEGPAVGDALLRAPSATPPPRWALPVPLALCLLALCLLGAACEVHPDDIAKPNVVPQTTLEAPPPPPVEGVGGERLFQLLYAGELGEPAWAAGQQARIFAWLRVMDLSADQLAGLIALQERVAAMGAAAEASAAAIGDAEAVAYGSLYAEISAALARPETTEAELDLLAERLAQSRAQVDSLGDPWTADLERTRALLDAVQPWLATLDRSRRERVTASRFFLTRRAAPLSSPGSYSRLTGMAWDGGDFQALSQSGRPDEQVHLDLGGLWSMEALRAAPGEYLVQRQIEAILAMALLEPALPSALQAWAAARSRPPLSGTVSGTAR